MSDIKKYMEMMAAIKGDKPPKGYTYSGIEDFLMKEGRAYTFEPGTLNRRGLGTPKECFSNAYHAVLNNPNLRYVEGLAIASFLPVNHAWVIDENDQIADVTWNESDLTPQEYFGVEIPLKLVTKVLAAAGQFGTIDAWPARWPLYKYDFKEIRESCQIPIQPKYSSRRSPTRVTFPA